MTRPKSIKNIEKTEVREPMKIGDSPMPGITLRQVLSGHTGVINRITWSNDGCKLATPSADMTIKIWDYNTGEVISVLNGHQQRVYCVAWSPDGRTLASGASNGNLRLWDISTGKTIRILKDDKGQYNALAWSAEGNLLAAGSEAMGVELWNVETGNLSGHLYGNKGNINNLKWSPSGNYIAGASGDRSVRIWDVKSGKLIHTLRGHTDWVFDVTWSPDGHFICSCSWDKTISIWDVETGKEIRSLEGHVSNIESCSLSFNGLVLASKSHDNTVKLWSMNTYQAIATLEEQSSKRYSPGLAFHPTLPILLTLGEQDTVVRIWELDIDMLLGDKAIVESVHYTTAKLVLVGDSGVGKTGLGWRLAHNEFKEHASTHGQQFWPINQLGKKRQDGTECAAVLWDLAGQHIYRPIHSIFLDNVDAALVLFDPSNRQEPLKGAQFWIEQLKGKTQLPPSILVGARVDRGTLVLSQQELEQFCQRYGISGGYVSTSAKSGEGLAQLLETLKAQIPWEQMTTTVTTVTFKRVKDYVLTLKEKPEHNGVLVRPAELRQQLQTNHPDWKFTDAEMMTAVGHLQNHGYVTILYNSSGEVYILLAPELLVSLASSIILKADKNLRELGAVNETELLQSKYDFEDLKGLGKVEGQILIDAAILRFLHHNICLRETLGSDILLIFPNLIKQKRPLQDNFVSVDDISYIVRGRVENLYAAMVVLFGYTAMFTRLNQWQKQAQYELGPDEICGFRLIEEREGELELVLYYSTIMPAYGRSLFQGLFESFLYKRDVEVTRFPPVFCPNQHRIERATVVKRARDGKNFTHCDECGERTLLPEIEKPELLGDKVTKEVQRAEAAARLRNAYETNLTRIKGFRRDRAAPRCYISHADDQAAWVATLVHDLRDAGMIVLANRSQIQQDDFILQICTPAYKQAWDAVTSRPGEDVGTIRTHLSHEPPRVIPLLCDGNPSTAIPIELVGCRAGNFCIDTFYPISLFDLVLSLYAITLNHIAFKPIREALRQQWKATFEANQSAGQKVFISYAWGEEHEVIVNELDQAFQRRGVTIIRDKRDLGFKGHIKAFMETMGEGKVVVLVISEKYLKSPNCCFELVQIARHGHFADRIFPIVLPDAQIYDPVSRLRYIEHWEQKKNELDETMKRVSAANLEGFRGEIDLYTAIRALLPKLMDVLKDMNTLSPALHQQSDFSELFDAVIAKL